MKYALNCKTLNENIELEDFLQTAAVVGFDGVEIRMGQAQQVASRKSAEYVSALFESQGLIAAGFVDGLRPGLLGEGTDYRVAADGWKQKCQLAQTIGCKTASVIINPRTAYEYPYSFDLATSRLKELCLIAEDYNVSVAVEAIGVRAGISPRFDGPNGFICRVSDAIRLAEAADSVNLGVILDVFHWYASGDSLEDVKAASGGPLLMVHVNDAPSGDRNSLTDADRLLPGEGVIGVPALLQTIAGQGFGGFCSVEVFMQSLWEMKPLTAARRAFEALRHTMDFNRS